MKSIRPVGFFLVILGLIHTVEPQPNHGTKLFIDKNNLLKIKQHKENIYIIDLKNDYSNQDFQLVCESGPNALDMNITFTGINSRTETLPSYQVDTPAKKLVALSMPSPLVARYTGRYECTAKYENNLVEVVSKFIYFFPNDGKLFLECPELGQLSKCLISYRINVPFTVPCKALHPEVQVEAHSNVSLFKVLLFLIYFSLEEKIDSKHLNLTRRTLKMYA
jgi:hypothetical protein